MKSRQLEKRRQQRLHASRRSAGPVTDVRIPSACWDSEPGKQIQDPSRRRKMPGTAQRGDMLYSEAAAATRLPTPSLSIGLCCVQTQCRQVT